MVVIVEFDEVGGRGGGCGGIVWVLDRIGGKAWVWVRADGARGVGATADGV